MRAKEESRSGGGKTYRQQNGDEGGRIAQALIRREETQEHEQRDHRKTGGAEELLHEGDRCEPD
jgi:hypothetical protein